MALSSSGWGSSPGQMSISALSQSPLGGSAEGLYKPALQIAGDFSSSSRSSLSKSQASSVGSGQSIMGAFKELQAKARSVERARLEAFGERDELLRQVGEKKRKDALARSRNESQGNEALLVIRSSCEAVRASQLEASARLYACEATLHAREKEATDKQSAIDKLELEVKEMHAHLVAMMRNNKQLDSELEAEHRRFETLSLKYQELIAEQSSKRARIQAQAENLRLDRHQLQETQLGLRRRAEALKSYISLVMNINASLVSSIEKQTQAARQLEKLVVLPRFSWPKGRIHSTLNLVTTAATDTVCKVKRRLKKRKKDVRRGGNESEVNTPRSSVTLVRGQIISPLPASRGKFKKLTRAKSRMTTRREAEGNNDSSMAALPPSAVSATDFLNALMRKAQVVSEAKQPARKYEVQKKLLSKTYMLPKTY